MGSSIFILLLLLLLLAADLSSSGPVFTDTIKPNFTVSNFTASNFQFIDQAGDFLQSINGTFKATIHNNLTPQDFDNYYFSVKHVASNAVVWSANPNNPISTSTRLFFTPRGLSLSDHPPIWSTPDLPSPASALRLLDSGNLLLLSATASVLWQSFDYPSDTLLPGQRLPVGKSLAAPPGDYRLTVTPNDAVLQWKGVTYWKLSMQTEAYKDTNFPVSFLSLNATALFLFAADGSTAVIKLAFKASSASFTAFKLGSDGRLSVSDVFSAPSEWCRLPNACGGLKMCDPLSSSSCSCPPGFVSKAHSDYDCFPADKSVSFPGCNTNNNNSSNLSYLKLGNNTDYFANDLSDPVREGLNLSACQDLCSRNCSCLALFHHSLSGSCFLVNNRMGSLIRNSAAGRIGYVKALAAKEDPTSSKHGGGFPVAALVVLPTTALFVIVGVALLATMWVKRKRGGKLGSESESESEEVVSIPGLPVRFEYEELVEATENFKNSIGSGGYGTVYKGTLGDGAAVAVKKMSNLGVQGKKEFLSEMSIIGSIHHLNLVRLKGYCVHGRQRFLVMEFMNRGSLEGLLQGPVLEWSERFEIAVGTARGLAYLHGGCECKIIHCDVKPENILLHHPWQVKISDFGLSKLLSPEQSSLFTTMRGTRGYLAPEWLTSSSISDKADVYSYGMVLLEMVRGRKNTRSSSSAGGPSSSSSDEAAALSGYFPLVALEMHEQRRYSELADPRLEGRVEEEEVEKMVKIALCCVHEDPSLRPSMASVVGMLEGTLPVSQPRLDSLNFLRFYGRRFMEPSQSDHSVSNPSHQFVMWKSATSSSCNSSSYISSHQLSGPR